MATPNASPPETSKGSGLPIQTLYMLVSLVASIVVVDLFYRVVVKPKVEGIALLKESGELDPTETSVWIILRDFEQQACITLFLWATALIVYKWWETGRERRLLKRGLLELGEADAIAANRATSLVTSIREKLKPSEQRGILPRALFRGLSRFRKGSNVEEVSSSINNHCEGELGRMESELSMINYIAWAIPSVGFIGTVRGIGGALAVAGTALGDDITQVTDKLGVAFNSTLIALLLSIPLMLFIHHIRQRQESTISEIEDYCQDNLVARLYRSPT
ncbi:MAG: MotA/TolQ/ExbB proton channel family protein [Planctomycetota bacterium]